MTAYAGGGMPGMTDDMLLPFQIESLGLRGRMARLGGEVDAVLRRHDYPEPVARMLGEALALAVLLAGALKYDGVFTLQIQSDGPISLLVADVTSDGHLRGYAQFDADRFASAAAARAQSGAGIERSVPGLLGAGHLAFTVDQGAHTDRYQGIVELTGATLADCAHTYFRDSEQIETCLKTACERVALPGGGSVWRAAGLMVQRMPAEGGSASEADRIWQSLTEDEAEDGWRRIVILTSSARNEELLAPELSPHELLFRLFHEDGVRVFEPHAVTDRCRCSRERVDAVLSAQPRAELDDMKEPDGAVVVTCQFCNRAYRYDDSDLDALADATRH
ncbi:Hsp33 family molecular chaperone [Oceanibaculum sp.]|uniref:Hsp33 family molecular chaperone n=1 Tax=Oceanibaculum sp. TaxID=1903597 RepID=UPI002585A089|nr:Hsp33 family molecular chaperone [Oceanibaculum sp.]MCH2394722.1 Hsp33 family molecular chaperone [Oceanibaculum sp.]